MGESDQKTFEAVVQREGKFTFVAIPFSPREVWGAKPRYYVTGTINDFAVRGTLGALGQSWISESGIDIGKSVTVTLSIEDR